VSGHSAFQNDSDSRRRQRGLSTLRQQFSTPLFVLMLVVGVVLLVACANVASLVLARSAARTPEFSIRLALGAGSSRLIG
jgi:putative ABC transport system permease protein